MKTVKGWVRETNSLAACVLLFYAVTCGIVARKQDAIEIFAGTHSSFFHVNGVFVYAMVVEIIMRLHAAVYTSYTEHALVSKTPTLRLPALLFSFPAMNAAVLVGVVKVTEVWGVFAIVGMTLLMLCCAWMLSISQVHSVAAAAIAIVSAALYLATWLLGVSTSLNSASFAVVCYIVAATGLMITYAIAVLVNGNRLRQETFMACSTLALYILGFAMYASVIDDKTVIAPWTAFAITIALSISFAVFSLCRLPNDKEIKASQSYENDTAHTVMMPFIDNEDDDDNEDTEEDVEENAAVRDEQQKLVIM